MRLSWKQVQSIQARAVDRGLNKRRDEKSFLKGHSYISILNDLEQGRVIDVVEGRTTRIAKSLINDSLSEKQKTKNNTLVGSKYLWLTNPENMSKKAKKSFRKFTINELKVGRAWSIKESFRHFWYYKYKGSAKSFFKKWYFWATHSKLKPIIKTAKTLKRHLEGIMTYLDHHITNAVSEGLNSKIQSIKANARRFRSFQNYRIAILFNCGKLELYP